MTDDSSPAAQFAAAAAAAAMASVQAEAVPSAKPAADTTSSDALYIPAAPAASQPDQAAVASAAVAVAVAEPAAETAAVAAVGDHGLANGAASTETAEKAPGADAERVVERTSAAAIFEGAIDSAVASNSGDDSDKDESAVAQPALSKADKPRASPKPKKAIDLADQELFPSLGSSAKAAPGWGSRAAAAALPGPPSIASQLKQNRATEVVDLPMMEEPIADTVRKISERTKTRIEASHNRALKTSTYLVSGRPENVAKAKREICAKLSPQITQTIQVPAVARSQITGARGRTLQAIQTQTHTTISLAKTGSGLDARSGGDAGLFEQINVAITGDHAGVAAAIAQVEAAVDKRTTKRAARVTDIPREAHALLDGKNGETMQAFQAAHPNVQIRLPGPIDADASIGIVGERDAVAAAAAALRESARTLMQSTQTVSVTVPKRQHRFVVGAGGQTLLEIMRTTGCSVSVPPPRGASDQITVRGTEANLVQALGLVMTKANSVIIDTMDPSTIHTYAHPLLYARRALHYFHDRNRFRRIESEHGVQLRVPSVAAATAAQSPEQVLIEVQAKDTHAAAAARQALVALFTAFPPFHFNSIDVEPHLHPLLAGGDGATVARLQTARSVYALFPKDSVSREIMIVYEGFNPDIDRFSPGADRERAVRDLLRKTLEEFRIAIQKDTSFVTQTVAVPIELQKTLSSGSALAAVKGVAESRVVLRFGSPEIASVDPENTRVSRRKNSAELEEDMVEIKGLVADVERVATELRRRVTAAEDYERLHSFRDQITVPQSMLARIIGRAGENLRRIRSERDVTIDVSDSTGGAPALVKVQGTREDVAAVITELGEFTQRLADQTDEVISVPAAIHRALIGASGRYVKRLEDKYAVRIQFPSSRRNGDDDGMQPLGADQIRIRGGRKGVDSAKAELLELAAYEVEHSHTVHFSVPASCLPHIVGKAGTRINEIKDESDTRIDLGEPKDGAVNVTLVGTRAATKMAREAIEAIVAEQEALIELALDIPIRHHRFLIGSGGSRVRELVQQAGGDPDAMTGTGSCRVQFPRASENVEQVKLKGDRAVVEAVRGRIEALVAERERMTTVTLAIPVSQHAFIIGRGGAHLKQLQDQHSVEIHFRSKASRASAPEDASAVRITGLPENCDACKAGLLALVRDEDAVTVPLALHQRLGGRNGSLWRRMRSEFDVQVDATHVDKALPRHADDPSDADADAGSATVIYRDTTESLAGLKAEWVLRGEKSKLAKALALVNQEIDNAESSIEARLRVDPRFHRHIIGKQGATIAAVRDATGCEVAVPKRGSNSQWVVVTGTRDAVDHAIDLINEAIEERD
ncbi:hypothetical protein GGF46_002731 [Coemansia sp. RSA 552]|nr:hypothetical protein GGF46_002731 [Coemansia sp. RSA 552]